jgi:hypothetical protein
MAILALSRKLGAIHWIPPYRLPADISSIYGTEKYLSLSQEVMGELEIVALENNSTQIKQEGGEGAMNERGNH